MSTTLLTELDKKIPIAGLDPPQCHAEEIFPSRIRVHTAGNPAPSQTRPVSGSSWSDAALNSRERGKFGGDNDQVSGPKRQSSFPTIQDKRQSNCPALVHAGSLPVPLPLGQLGNIRNTGQKPRHRGGAGLRCYQKSKARGGFSNPPAHLCSYRCSRGLAPPLPPPAPPPPLPCVPCGRTHSRNGEPPRSRARCSSLRER